MPCGAEFLWRDGGGEWSWSSLAPSLKEGSKRRKRSVFRERGTGLGWGEAADTGQARAGGSGTGRNGLSTGRAKSTGPRGGPDAAAALGAGL